MNQAREPAVAAVRIGFRGFGFRYSNCALAASAWALAGPFEHRPSAEIDARVRRAGSAGPSPLPFVLLVLQEIDPAVGIVDDDAGRSSVLRQDRGASDGFVARGMRADLDANQGAPDEPLASDRAAFQTSKMHMCNNTDD